MRKLGKIGTFFIALSLGAATLAGVGRSVFHEAVAADDLEEYNLGTIPTKGWSASGGSQTMNEVVWTYTSSTYLGTSNGNIQIGSKNNPQTNDWTISTPFSSFEEDGYTTTIKSISITGYTTSTSATYKILNGTNILKSGSLTTSSATYSEENLSLTSGNISVTLKGSSTSKAMYLGDIVIKYEKTSASTKKLNSIDITKEPNKKNYVTGDTLDTTGLEVNAIYIDATTTEVTDKVTFSGYNMSTTGDQTVTVSYTEGEVTKTATFGINIAARVLTSIVLSGQTTSFHVGDTFEFDGVVTALYNQGKSDAIVEPTSVSKSGVLTAADDGATVTVSYTEGGVTVSDDYVISVTLRPLEIVFYSEASGSNAISSSARASTLISEGTEFVLSNPFGGVTQVEPKFVYYGKDNNYMARIGKSGDPGELKIKFSSELSSKFITSIDVYCFQYTADKGKTIKLENCESQVAPNEEGVLNFTINDVLSELNISTSGYIYLHKLEFNVGTAPSTYTVTYNKGAETAIGSLTDPNSPYVENSTVTVLAPGDDITNPGHSFVNWKDQDGNFFDPNDTESNSFTITQDTTLTAQWEVVEVPYVKSVDITGSFETIELLDKVELSAAVTTDKDPEETLSKDVVWTVTPSDAGTFNPVQTNSGSKTEFTVTKQPSDNEITIRAASVADENVYKEFTASVTLPTDLVIVKDSFKIAKEADAKTEYDDSDTEVDTRGLTTSVSMESSSKSTYVVTVDVTADTNWTLDIENELVIASLNGTSETDSFPITVKHATRYNLVTSADQLIAGDVYVIGCSSKDKVAGPMGEQKYLSAEDATFNDNELSSSSAIEFTLGGETDAWTFTSSEGTIGATAAKSLSVDDVDRDTTWKISISEQGIATITNNTSGYGDIKYNSSSPRFLNYASGQTAVQLYKKPLPQVNVTINVNNINCDFASGTTTKDREFTANFDVNNIVGYNMPTSVSVLFDGDQEATSYNLVNGKLTIPASDVTTDFTVTASGVAKVVDVEYFNMEDASFVGTVINTHSYGQSDTLPTATKDEYAFIGWFNNADLEGDPVTTLGATDYDCTEDINLYAKWVSTAITYTVTYYNDEKSSGLLPSAGEYEPNETITIANPIPLTEGGLTRCGFNLVAWQDSEGTTYEFGSTLPAIADLDLYPVWEFDGQDALDDVRSSMRLAFDYQYQYNNVWKETTSIKIGDTVSFVCDNPDINKELIGINTNNSTHYGIGEEYDSSKGPTLKFEVCKGSKDGTFAFKLKDAESDTYLSIQSGKNSLDYSSGPVQEKSSWFVTLNGTKNIIKNSSEERYLYWNNNNSGLRFACYADKSDDGNYYKTCIYSLQKEQAIINDVFKIKAGISGLQKMVSDFEEKWNTTVQDYGICITKPNGAQVMYSFNPESKDSRYVYTDESGVTYTILNFGAALTTRDEDGKLTRMDDYVTICAYVKFDGVTYYSTDTEVSVSTHNIAELVQWYHDNGYTAVDEVYNILVAEGIIIPSELN